MEYYFWKTINKFSPELKKVKNEIDEKLRENLKEKWFLYKESGKTSYGKIYDVYFTFAITMDFIIIRYIDMNDKKYNLKILGTELGKLPIQIYETKEEVINDLNVFKNNINGIENN